MFVQAPCLVAAAYFRPALHVVLRVDAARMSGRAVLPARQLLNTARELFVRSSWARAVPAAVVTPACVLTGRFHLPLRRTGGSGTTKATSSTPAAAGAQQPAQQAQAQAQPSGQQSGKQQRQQGQQQGSQRGSQAGASGSGEGKASSSRSSKNAAKEAAAAAAAALNPPPSLPPRLLEFCSMCVEEGALASVLFSPCGARVAPRNRECPPNRVSSQAPLPRPPRASQSFPTCSTYAVASDAELSARSRHRKRAKSRRHASPRSPPPAPVATLRRALGVQLVRQAHASKHGAHQQGRHGLPRLQHPDCVLPSARQLLRARRFIHGEAPPVERRVLRPRLLASPRLSLTRPPSAALS